MKAQSPYFHTLNTQKGLLDNVNAFLFRDSRGYLWSSSLSGINRTDGLHTVTYKQNSRKNSLRGVNMQANFQEDSRGYVWFGVDGYLNMYRPESDDFQSFMPSVKGGDTLSNIKLAHIDAALNVWFTATSSQYKGLFIFNPNTQQTRYWPLPIDDMHNVRAVCDPQGKLLSFLVFKYGNASLTEWRFGGSDQHPPSVYTYFTGQNAYKFFNVHVDAQQIVWAATEKGLLHWDMKTGRTVLYNMAGNQPIKPLKSVSANSRYVAIWEEQGVLRIFSKKTGQFIQTIVPDNRDTEGGLRSYTFFLGTVLLDENDYCFLADWATGIQFTQLFKTRLLLWPQNLSVKQQDETKVCPTAQNWVWVFENGRQLHQYAPDGRLLRRIAWPLSFRSPRQLETMPDGSLWLLLRQPESVLVRVDGLTGQIAVINGFDKGQKPISLTVTPDNHLLVYTSDKHLSDIQNQGGIWRPIALLGGQPLKTDGNISAMAVDAQNRLFMASETLGLLVFDRSTGQLRRQLSGYNISQIVVDADNLWLSGSAGLLRYRPATGAIDTLFSGSYINFVATDPQNRVWFTSATQLHILDKSTERLSNLGKTDGAVLSPNPFLRVSPDGQYLYLEGVGGLRQLNLKSFRFYEVKPRPSVSFMKVNGEIRGWTYDAQQVPTITLRHDENFLDFVLSGIDYGAPDEVALSYFLDNWDKDTTERPARDNRATYQRLSPGQYMLSVWAKTAQGGVSEAPFKLQIIILPPWWQTWWAYVLYGLFVGGSVYGVYAYRTARFRQEAAAKQKNLEMEMMAFRAQMNPHFISNALNAINAYIVRHDTVQASRYLSDFAQLMRKVLTESAQEMIAVEDELETIEGYVKMEALRFGSNFDYHIEVDEAIDTWAAKMPTMIVQPFIENAVLHGLMHKLDGTRQLSIRFRAETEQYMLCEVEDNGIGRYKSALINQKNRHAKYESKGMFITKYRLMMLADKYKCNANFIVEDVINGAGEVGGTRVTLRLPLIYD